MQHFNLKYLKKFSYLLRTAGFVLILFTSWISNVQSYLHMSNNFPTNNHTRCYCLDEQDICPAALYDRKGRLLNREILMQKGFNEISVKRLYPDILVTDNTRNAHKIDWHDYKAMYDDIRRVGIGEQGKAATLQGDVDRDLESKLITKYGFNAMLSDAISVNRSVADVRNAGCLHKKYLDKLPTISVVIPFHNERLSVLLRSVQSIMNRSPPELLKEIILVDDFSDDESLGKQLDQYVADHFDKVQIVRLPERLGLIRARMVGLREATAEAFVIFDAHIEVNYNWLPPLLDPIALNERTVTCPSIDRIYYANFEYQHEWGGRGGFDWTLRYVQVNRLPDDLLDLSKPFKTPVMKGGLFAISAKFFWELGAYDEGLDIWGGEQYELSFKIWMCGGQILDVPCSRVGHVYKGPDFRGKSPREFDYLTKNYKRIAEVWMDEYKHYLYTRANGAYEAVDEGDLSVQKALREKLQCKSFKWFVEVVAPDVFEKYPPVDPSPYAYGAVQNVGAPNLCMDSFNRPWHTKFGLSNCSQNLTHPEENQMFKLTWRFELRRDFCLDVHEHQSRASVWQWECHEGGGNQYWFYDRQNKWILSGETGNRCLGASLYDGELYVDTCQKDNVYMQWNFGFVNETAFESFFENLNKQN